MSQTLEARLFAAARAEALRSSAVWRPVVRLGQVLSSIALLASLVEKRPHVWLPPIVRPTPQFAVWLWRGEAA